MSWTLLDIGAVLPVTLDRLDRVTLTDAAREGRILEAKVTAMVSNTLARLTIEGQTLDVATPQPLAVGSTLTLKAERGAGELRLITQGPIRAPETGTGQAPLAGDAQAMPGAAVDAVKSVLARVQALAMDAMLADPGAVEQAPAQGVGQATATAGQAQGAAAAGQGAPAQGGQAATAQGGQTANAAPVPQGSNPAAPGAQSQPAAPQAAMPDLPGAATPSASPLATSGGNPATPAPQNPVPSAPQADARAPATPTPALPSPASAETRLLDMLDTRPREAVPFAPMLAELAFAEAIQEDEAAAPQPRNPADATAARPPLTHPGLPGQGATPADMTPADFTAMAAQDRAAASHDARAAAAALTDMFAANAASDSGPPQHRVERAVHFAIDVPLHFPGNPAPLRLEVSREEAEAEKDSDTARPPTWSIRFAAEAGPLGMIHAAITFADGQVGVQLWAERGETASLFNEHVAQLQDALTASDLRVEALTIAEGRPEVRAADRDAATVERML